MTKSDVLLTIQNISEPISLMQLLEIYPNSARRTLQRWLKQLIEENQLYTVGEGRARKYLALKQNHGIKTKQSDFTIPLSMDSQDILTYINQSIEMRKPVGFQHDFLASYQPNKSYYLSEPLRRQLKKMGSPHHVKSPAGTYSRAILNRLLIDLSWASSHLEGNTYSLLDTQQLIENGHCAQGKASVETQMILNHKSAIELLVENANTIDFNRFTILNLHSTLAENLLANPADEGRLRQHMVEIGKSTFRPISVPTQLDELFELMLDKAKQISDPFEQSFFIMVHLPYLQPFADINKRTSRLAANIPLIKANLCPMTFLGIPEKFYNQAILGVYELSRIELLRDLYVWAYERSTQEYLAIKQSLAEPEPLRLAYREIIKKIIKKVVCQPDKNMITLIEKQIKKQVPKPDQANIQALIIDEIRRLHEGVLARYGLKPSEFYLWKKHL